MDIIKYYFLGVYLTTIVAAWIFIDVEDAMDRPIVILEEVTVALLLGILWPVVVPVTIIFKMMQICQTLFTAEK